MLFILLLNMIFRIPGVQSLIYMKRCQDFFVSSFGHFVSELLPQGKLAQSEQMRHPFDLSVRADFNCIMMIFILLVSLESSIYRIINLKLSQIPFIYTCLRLKNIFPMCKTDASILNIVSCSCFVKPNISIADMSE